MRMKVINVNTYIIIFKLTIIIFLKNYYYNILLYIIRHMRIQGR